MTMNDEPMVTKTGKVLTDADIEALAAEAERGYDVSKLTPRKEAALALVREYEAEHGVITEDELRQLDSEWLL